MLLSAIQQHAASSLYAFDSPAQALLQTDKPVAPDNNVIHQVNIEKFRGLHQLFSHSDVLWRRRWISTRMIVTDDYGGAVANNSRTKYFGRAQYRTINRPLVAIDILHHLVFCIEYQDAHLFMVKVHHFWHGEVSKLPSDGETHQVSLSGHVSSYST